MKKYVIFLLCVSGIFFQAYCQKTKKNFAPIDWKSSPAQPIVTFHSLLQHLDWRTNGQLIMSAFDCVFIPLKDINGKIVNYGQDNPPRIFAKVYKENELIKNVPFYMLSLNNYFSTIAVSADKKKDAFGVYQTNMTSYNENSTIQTKGEGMYTISFCLDDSSFYKFDFEVIKKTSTNPYIDQKDFYFMKGPWNDYGYVDLETFNAEYSELYWSFFNTSFNANDFVSSVEEQVPVKWKIELYDINNKLYATNDDCNQTNGYCVDMCEVGKYQRFFVRLLQTNTKLENMHRGVHRTEMPDGIYTLKLYIEGEETKEFKLEMKDHFLVMPAIQDRKKTSDYSMLIEGKDAKSVKFFYKKVK